MINRYNERCTDTSLMNDGCLFCF